MDIKKDIQPSYLTENAIIDENVIKMTDEKPPSTTFSVNATIIKDSSQLYAKCSTTSETNSDRLALIHERLRHLSPNWQILCLVCVMIATCFAHTAVPIMMAIASDNTKGKPNESSFIITSSLFSGVIALICESQRVKPRGLSIISLDSVKVFTLPALGFTISNILELVAVSKSDPLSYQMIQQSKLGFGALMGYLLYERKITSIQFAAIISASAALICYSLICEKNTKPEFNTALILAISRSLISLLASAGAEYRFRTLKTIPFHERLMSMNLVNLSFAILLFVFKNGIVALFNPYELYKNWSLLYLLVSLFISGREWIMALCVTALGNTTKNIMSTLSTSLSYASSILLQNSFGRGDIIRLLLCIIIIVGSLDDSLSTVGSALVGKASCGDMMKLSINTDENDIIIDAKYKTFGCGSAIASSDYLTQLIIGKSLKEAQEIVNTDIKKALDLPAVKIHCSVLAEEALKEAISNLLKKREVKQ